MLIYRNIIYVICTFSEVSVKSNPQCRVAMILLDVKIVNDWFLVAKYPIFNN